MSFTLGCREPVYGDIVWCLWIIAAAAVLIKFSCFCNDNDARRCQKVVTVA